MSWHAFQEGSNYGWGFSTAVPLALQLMMMPLPSAQQAFFLIIQRPSAPDPMTQIPVWQVESKILVAKKTGWLVKRLSDINLVESQGDRYIDRYSGNFMNSTTCKQSPMSQSQVGAFSKMLHVPGTTPHHHHTCLIHSCPFEEMSRWADDQIHRQTTQ